MAQVRIRIEKGDGSPTSESSVQNVTQDENRAKQLGKVAVISVFAHQTASVIKQAISVGASNVKNFTGSQLRQEEVQNMLDAVGDISAIGFGLASGGIVGGAVAVTGIVVKKSIEVFNYYEGLRHQEITQDYLYARSGNALISGSRGTEN